MFAEHELTTTREPSAVLEEASMLLTRLGFCVVERTDGFVVARKTHRRPHYVKSLADLPQSVRVEHDRDRVQIALIVEDVQKEGPLHEKLLLSVARVLEGGLSEGLPPEAALAAWREVEGALRREGQRRRRRQASIWIGLGVFLIVAVFLLAFIFRKP